MRREADALTVGPAPVDEVVRLGRRTARRRRGGAPAVVAVATAAVLAFLTLGMLSDLEPGTRAWSARHGPATAPPRPAPVASGAQHGVRAVEPYKPVDSAVDSAVA